MKTFLVPFQEQETVWVEYQAKVEANSLDEAFLKVKQLVDNCDSPHQEYDCENIGITEHIESDCKFFMDDYTSDDVRLFDERICCELSYNTLNFLNTNSSKHHIIKDTQEKFRTVGLILEIEKFELKPIAIEEQFVKYDFVPTKYKRTFANGDIEYFEDGKKLDTPLKECSIQQINEKRKEHRVYAEIKAFENSFIGYISPLDNEDAFFFKSNECLFEKSAKEYIVDRVDYILKYGLLYPVSIDQLEILKDTVEKECLYDRKNCIELPSYIDIKVLESRLLEAKSSVVRFKNKTYIVAKKDGEWVLWECSI